MVKYERDAPDPYLESGADVLRNLVGARNQAELDRIEAALSSVRAAEIEAAPPAGRFDLEHLRSVHKHLFGDVYPWAGEIRTVIIDKGETRFAMPEHIESSAHSLFRKLDRENHLQGLDPNAFAQRAGHYLGEINALHPFREGNGRTQRAFIGQLAHAAGYHIALDRIDQHEMVAAYIRAMHQSSDHLAKLVRDHLSDRDQAAALALGRNQMQQQSPFVLAESGQSYEGRLLGATQHYVVQALPDNSLVLHRRARLSPSIGEADVAKLGQRAVEIRYPVGMTGLVREERSIPDRERERSISPKQRDRDGREKG